MYRIPQISQKIPRYVPYTANQPKNTEICTVYRKSAKKCCDMYRILQISPKIPRYKFLLILPSPTLKKCACGNILAPFCGQKAKVVFFLTEFMPFKCEYNSNFYNNLIKIQISFFSQFDSPKYQRHSSDFGQLELTNFS